MKKLLAVLSFLLLTAAMAYPAHADGCYICAGGGYARYRGSDTFAKRKEAQRKCGCKVTGTTSKCSNPKCTVSVMGPEAIPKTPRSAFGRARPACGVAVRRNMPNIASSRRLASGPAVLRIPRSWFWGWLLDLTPLIKALNRHLGLGIDICAAAQNSL